MMTDTDEHRGLATLLRAIELPPSDLDVESIVDTGRRAERRRRRTVGAVAAGLTALVLVGSAAAVTLAGRTSPPAAPAVGPATSPSQVGCAVQPLTLPSGVDAFLSATDRTGNVFAGVASAGGTPAEPIVWIGVAASIVRLPASVADQGLDVVGVNAIGELVLTGGSAHRASWLYRNGTTTRLPGRPGDTDVMASRIDAAGDVVGSTRTSDGTLAAVIWSRADPSTARGLATPKGRSAMATTIDNAGTIGGSLGDGEVPYVWNTNGIGHPLAVPSGHHGGQVFDVAGDWAVGWVGGVSDPSDRTAARWNLRTGAVDVFNGRAEGRAVASNGAFAGGVGNTYLFHDGVFDDLPGLVGQGANQVVGVLADGAAVVGQAASPLTESGSADRPVTWRC